MSQCIAFTLKRERCKKKASVGSQCCYLHQEQCRTAGVVVPQATLPPPVPTILPTPVPTILPTPQYRVNIPLPENPVPYPTIQLREFPGNPLPRITYEEPIRRRMILFPFQRQLPLNDNKVQTRPQSPRPQSPRPQSPRPQSPGLPLIPIPPVAPAATHDCCVCLENQVAEKDLLVCRHPVCLTCISQLQDPICPMCRHPLEGRLVTNEILIAILQRKEDDRLLDETANLITAMLLQDNPDMTEDEAYTQAYAQLR